MCSLIKKAVPTLSLVYTSLAMFPFRFSEGVISTTGGDQGVFSRIQTTEQAMRDACTNHFAAKLLAFFFFCEPLNQDQEHKILVHIKRHNNYTKYHTSRKGGRKRARSRHICRWEDSIRGWTGRNLNGCAIKTKERGN